MMYPRGPIHNTKISSQGKVRAKKRIYTIFIVTGETLDWRLYHCPDCRNALAQYKGDLIAEIPGEAPKTYPLMIQCKNSNCGRKILFKECVEQA